MNLVFSVHITSWPFQACHSAQSTAIHHRFRSFPQTSTPTPQYTVTLSVGHTDSRGITAGHSGWSCINEHCSHVLKNWNGKCTSSYCLFAFLSLFVTSVLLDKKGNEKEKCKSQSSFLWTVHCHSSFEDDQQLSHAWGDLINNKALFSVRLVHRRGCSYPVI